MKGLRESLLDSKLFDVIGDCLFVEYFELGKVIIFITFLLFKSVDYPLSFSLLPNLQISFLGLSSIELVVISLLPLYFLIKSLL